MATIIQKTETEITVQVTIKLSGSMLNMEELIRAGVNEVGGVATSEALSRFDATGDPIKIAGIKLTSKGKIAKEYQTPYCAVMLERHVYQSHKGGATYWLSSVSGWRCN